MATAKNISTENKINIVTNTENNVTVTQPSIQAVEILTGPQGATGTAGTTGPAGPTGSLNLSSSLGPINVVGTLTVTGSVIISGSNTFTNTGLALFNGAFAQGDNSSQVTNQSFIDAMGAGAFAQGQVTRATGEASHAEGRETEASGTFSHAQGEHNYALGRASFVAGEHNTSSAAYSFVIGNKNINTDGQWSFAAGYANTSTEDAKYSTVLGYQSHVLGWAAVAMGRKTSASFYGFASGDETLALFAAHAEGRYTIANSRYTHAEGVSTTAGGRFVQGFTSSATEPTSNWGDDDPGAAINDGDVWYNTSNALLYSFTGSGFPTGSSPTSSAFIPQNSALLLSPIPLTFFSTSSGLYSSASFGSGDTFPPTSASATVAARFNYGTAKHSHAEGVLTQTYGRNSHAEGKSTTAGGFASHTEGYFTRTGIQEEYGAVLEGGSGSYAHAEGYQTQANGIASHAEGLGSRARGDYSHAEGLVTIAEGDYQHTMGRYNVSNTHSLVIIGNGTSSNNKRNLVEFDLNGVVINQPVTASSNISASGNIDGSILQASQRVTTPAIRSAAGGIVITPLDGNLLIQSNITASSNISASGTIFANDLILDYDSLPTSDPSTKGQVYRNGSNQLFISAG